MNYILTDNPEEKDLSEIRNNMKEFNLAHIEPKEVKPLALFVLDENGEKIGGLTAETHGNWLEVDFLWVKEGFRKSGMGSRMLHNAEEEAIKRGCKFCFLDTFDFQAKGFYLKYGYKEVFALEDYPLKGKKHYLVKVLVSEK